MYMYYTIIHTCTCVTMGSLIHTYMYMCYNGISDTYIHVHVLHYNTYVYMCYTGTSNTYMYMDLYDTYMYIFCYTGTSMIHTCTCVTLGSLIHTYMYMCYTGISDTYIHVRVTLGSLIHTYMYMCYTGSMIHSTCTCVTLGL